MKMSGEQRTENHSLNVINVKEYPVCDEQLTVRTIFTHETLAFTTNNRRAIVASICLPTFLGVYL
jgi:hypothetical protein